MLLGGAIERRGAAEAMHAAREPSPRQNWRGGRQPDTPRTHQPLPRPVPTEKRMPAPKQLRDTSPAQEATHLSESLVSLWEHKIVVSRREFKEAEQSRVFWQNKMSVELGRALQLSVESRNGMMAMQQQVLRLRESVEQRMQRGIGATATAMPATLPTAAKQATEELDPVLVMDVDLAADSAQQQLNMMIKQSMDRASGGMRERIERLHDRLDDVYRSQLTQFNEMHEDLDRSKVQGQRLEALLSEHPNEQVRPQGSEAPSTEHKRTANEDAHNSVGHNDAGQPQGMSHSNSDPLVAFGKMRAKTKHLDTKSVTLSHIGASEAARKTNRDKKALHAIQTFTMQSELALPAGEEEEMGVLGDALDAPQRTPVQVCLNRVGIVSTILVVANTFFMGFEVDITMNHWRQGEKPPGWMFVVEVLFSVAFVIEILIRVVLERLQFIKGPNRYWNAFDFVIIAFGLFESFHHFGGSSVLRTLRVLKLARTARIMRTIKALRICRLLMAPEVWQPLLWGFTTLIFFLYIFALAFTTLTVAHVEQGEVQNQQHQLLDLYGSVGRSMVTFFYAMTGGEPWRALAQPLEAASPVAGGLFVACIFFTLFGLMNTVTAVYVDAFIYYSNLDRSASERSVADKGHLKQLRSHLLSKPVNKTGKIERKHLNEVLVGPGAPLLRKLNLEIWVVQALFRLLDSEDDNSVEIDQFLFGLLHLKGNAANIQIVTLMNLVKRLNSKVTKVSDDLEDHFPKVLEALNRSTPPEAIRASIDSDDDDDEGESAASSERRRRSVAV